MESATIRPPPSTGLSGILLSFLKDQNMKKINTVSMYGEKFNKFHAAQQQLLQPLNNLDKRILQNRESLHYKKTANSVLLSLFENAV